MRRWHCRSSTRCTAVATRAGSDPLKKPPLRMAFLYVPNGVHMPDWTPHAEGQGFDLPPILEPL